MKKMLLLIIGLFLCIILLSGCGDKTDLSSLYNRLNDLEDQIFELETQIASNTIKAQEYEDQIAVLEKNRATTRTQISTLERQIAVLEENDNDEVNIFLADEYHLVPGDTFQLFYRSIIQAVDPYRYHIKLTGDVGNGYNRYYEWTPDATHNGKSYSLKVEVRTDSGISLGEATTILKVSSLKETTSKNILCIGASMTTQGQWVAHGYSQYLKAGGTPHTFIGTVKGTFEGTTVLTEGRGGWQWSNFVTKYDTIDSPFKANTASGISFSEYCQKNGFSGIDEIVCLMTYNGVGGSFRTYSLTAEPFVSMKKLIDQLHLDYPNAKVTLMSMPQPSLDSGLGNYYAISSSFGDNYGAFVSLLRYNDQLEKFSKQAAYSSFVRYVDAKGQFDSEYNMPSSPKPVNKYSSITEKIGTSMGIHPNVDGQKQIGDAFYRILMHGWTKK